MPFEKGNKWWNKRANHGPARMIESAQALTESCNEYFQYVEDSPLFEDKVGFSEGCAVHTDVKKVHAMTITGLCLFLGIANQTWYSWKDKYPDLADVQAWAEQCIWRQKFTAAAAGLLNANIISRELGLAEKTDINMPTPTLIINPPAGARPYPVPPIHGEGEENATG